MSVLLHILKRRLETRDTKRPLAELRELALEQEAPRDFRAALRLDHAVAVIAEIKFRSPSEGELRSGRDVGEIAAAYTRAGARALSVLTEVNAFDGKLGYVRLAKTASDLPVLRKDFLWDEYDVTATRAAGADALLLIAKMLSREQLSELCACADALGLGVLLELHDEDDLQKTEGLRGVAWGVNHRDLMTLDIDLQRSRDLFTLIPDGEIKVAESGLRTLRDLEEMRERGANAVLIGTAFMKAPDPGRALTEFFL